MRKIGMTVFAALMGLTAIGGTASAQEFGRGDERAYHDEARDYERTYRDGERVRRDEERAFQDRERTFRDREREREDAWQARAHARWARREWTREHRERFYRYNDPCR
jgi:hypothetical protein